MVFSYDEKSGSELLKIEGESFRHLFLARRSKADKTFLFRNLRDGFLYEYEVQNVSKKDATLRLISNKKDESKHASANEIAWCVADPKTIEKTLPMLNEIGVSKLYFVYSDRSQKNFKLDMDRINRILINSCCQCGRSDLMDTYVYESLKDFCADKKEFFAFDFGGEPVSKVSDGIFLVGPEGGFSEDEKKFLSKNAKKILSFKTKNILRSETAVVLAASLALVPNFKTI